MLQTAVDCVANGPFTTAADGKRRAGGPSIPTLSVIEAQGVPVDSESDVEAALK